MSRTGTAAAEESGPAGLLDFQRRRKAGSHGRLLAAAADLFCARGYFAVSVEEIASAAGVSRMTFYRHFSGKAAIASALFTQNSRAAMSRLLAIGQSPVVDRAAVTGWLSDLFALDRAHRQLLRVFIQASVEPDFTDDAHGLIADLIAGLGATIPAFAIDRDAPDGRRRWIEAWLILYEILDQSNHAALDSGVATDPVVIDVLADRFLRFVAGQ